MEEEAQKTSAAAQDIRQALSSMPAPAYSEDEFGETVSPPIVRMVNAIIVQAIDSRASDIHLEPMQRNLSIRYRVDGVLHEQMVVPKHVEGNIMRRFQVMADIPFYKSEPQTGIIPIRHNNRNYRLRVTSIRSAYGITLAVRILENSFPLHGLAPLGVTANTEKRLEWHILPPRPGLAIVAGGHGEGRTTTVGALLHRLNSITRKIFFLQSHLEYDLAGITSVPIRPERGMGIEAVMESVLRQDTDMVALEINDAASVRAAVQAVQAGISVFGILNVPTAYHALKRLSLSGLTPEFIAGNVLGILAQRLLPVLCPDCTVDDPVPTTELQRFNPLLDRFITLVTNLKRGTGCETCRGRGVRERVGIFEFLPIEVEVAYAIRSSARDSDLRDAVHAALHPSLRLDALEKAMSGVISSHHLQQLDYNLSDSS